MLGRGTTIFPDNLALGTAGEEAFACAPGTDRGARAAPARRRPEPRPVPGRAHRPLQPQHRHPLVRQGSRRSSRRYGVARIRGQMAQGGLSACPKHFPGKGHSPLDAHLKLPTIDSTPEEMRRDPPAAVSRRRWRPGVECLMTSHPVYPKLDPERRARHVLPAASSVTGCGASSASTGVIVSDDLEMGAVSETCPIGEADGAHGGGRPRSAARLPHRARAAGRRRGAGERLSRAAGCRSTSARRPPSACAGCAWRARRGARAVAPVPEPDGRAAGQGRSPPGR